MFCPRCGSQLKQEAYFCTKCGFKLKDRSQSDQPMEPVVKQDPTEPVAEQDPTEPAKKQNPLQRAESQHQAEAFKRTTSRKRKAGEAASFNNPTTGQKGVPIPRAVSRDGRMHVHALDFRSANRVIHPG